jgi:hypothetical protein
MKAENVKINTEVIIKDSATGAAKGFVGKVGKIQSTCSHNGLYWVDVGNNRKIGIIRNIEGAYKHLLLQLD